MNIDRIIKKKSITITELAKRMELSRESVYRILQGNPTLNNIEKLANALEVPISDLFNQEPPAVESLCTCPKCGTILKIDLQIS